MNINIDDQIDELVGKVTGYIAEEEDGWKLVKKTKEVTISCRQSDEFEGNIFKGEGVIEASPEQVFEHCDPKPYGRRMKWDAALKGLEVIEYLRKNDPETYLLRTMTHSAAMGFISARDFVDFVVNLNTDEFVGTLAHHVETDGCPVYNDFVRGTNHYCGILCYRIPGDLNKTKIYYIAQSDIGGMIPRSLVESALPNAIMDFYTNVRKQVECDSNQMSF